MSESIDNFLIECSDDESYQNSETNYRIVSGKKIWEPNGQQISSLYRQLEAKGFIELRWQCPGRRSPSVHNINVNDRQKTENIDIDNNLSDKTNDLLNEFDFESEFGTESQVPNIATKSGPPKRQRQTGLKKSQTNLTKVMADIKKYQFIDQQTKRLSLQTSSPSTPTPTTTQSSSELTTHLDSTQTISCLSQSSGSVGQMVSTSLSSLNISNNLVNTSQSTLNTSETTFSVRSDSPTDIMP